MHLQLDKNAVDADELSGPVSMDLGPVDTLAKRHCSECRTAQDVNRATQP